MQCVNHEFMNYGYTMCNDFTDMQCVNKDFMYYGYAMRNDFMHMQCVMTLWICNA